MTPQQKLIHQAVLNDLLPIIHKKSKETDVSMYVPFLEKYLDQPISEAVIQPGPYNGIYNQLAAITTTGSIAISYKDFARFIACGKRKPKATSHKKINEACRTAVIGTKKYEDFPSKFGYEVDHCGLYEFVEIVQKFIEQSQQLHNLDIDGVANLTEKQPDGTRCFTCDQLKNDFIDIHEQLAELQYLKYQDHKEKTRQSRLKH